MKLLHIHKKYLIFIGIIILFSIPAILPLFHAGFFKTDDGDWMVIRFSAFYQALRDGQFPVRFLPRLNFDYGYPVANFLYPGFMYLGTPIHLLGFGFVSTIKIILGGSVVFSGIFCFLWLRKLFFQFPAIVGSLLYVYAPYHLYDLYVRGSVGEMLALCIVPFIFWQFERKSIVLSALGLAFLILSHNTLAVLFFPVFFLYGYIRFVGSDSKRFVNLVYTFLLAIGVAAFFWIPAIMDLKYTVFSKTVVSEWKEYFAFRDMGIWGMGLLLLSGVLLLAYIKISKKKDSTQHILVYLFSGMLFTSLFLNLPVSSVIWEILPISFIQFPFRLLSLQIISVTFLVPFFLQFFSKKRQYMLGVIVFFLLSSPNLFILKPLEYSDKGDGFYSTNEDTTTVKREYMPIWVERIPEMRPISKIELQDGRILSQSIRSNQIVLTVSTLNNTNLGVNTVYFPGWYAKVDGAPVPIMHERGIIQLVIPKGEHTIEIFWKETPLRTLSNGISIGSILVLLFFAYKKKVL